MLQESSTSIKHLVRSWVVNWQLLFGHWVASDSLWLHDLKNTNLPCPLPFPWVWSNTWLWVDVSSLLSHVRLFMTPWTVAYEAPPSMGFSRQEYWILDCHFLRQGIFPTQGLNPDLLHCRQTFYPLSRQGAIQLSYPPSTDRSFTKKKKQAEMVLRTTSSQNSCFEAPKQRTWEVIRSWGWNPHEWD